MERFLELVKSGDIFIADYHIPAFGHNDAYEGLIIRDKKVLDYFVSNPDKIPEKWKNDPTPTDSLIIVFDTFYFRGSYSFFLDIPSGYYWNSLYINFEKGEVKRNLWSMPCGFDWHCHVLVKKTSDLKIFQDLPYRYSSGGD